MKTFLLIVTLAGVAVPAVAQQHQHPQRADSAASDSAFRQVQARGRRTMGVDQTASKHGFADLGDGGRIELVSETGDTADVRTIRAHLLESAGQFARGDFTAPFLTHAQVVPGTAVMAARRAAIRYTYRDLPRGGEIRITTRDPGALAAIREFLAFQRADHRADAH